jgi:hypothetical protein
MRTSSIGEVHGQDDRDDVNGEKDVEPMSPSIESGAQ